MQQQKLLNALSAVTNTDAAIKGVFNFSRTYDQAYPCYLRGITLAYLKEGSWEVTLHFVEDEDKTPSTSKTTKSDAHATISKAALVSVLSLVNKQECSVSATFKYSEPWNLIYRGEITSIELNINADNTDDVAATIIMKEVKKEAKVAA